MHPKDMKLDMHAFVQEPLDISNLSPLFRATAAALDGGLILANTGCQVCFMNRQAEELLGLDGATAEGQGLIALLRDYQADTLIRDVLSDGETRETTIQPLFSGLTLRLCCTPLVTGDKINGVLLLIRDMTQISMLERARRDLVANVSHELRTPLASLKLLIETLQTSPPPHVAQHMLNQAAQEVDVVTQLVDELHELAQIESGRITLQLTPSRINAVVARAMDRIHPQAERKNLRISADIPPNHPLVLMDEKRVGQVLLNLLHNAVKFTPDAGEITVRACTIIVDAETPHLGYIEQGDEEARHHLAPHAAVQYQAHPLATVAINVSFVTLPAPHPPGLWSLISVSDNGIGIPARDLPRIFERFYKVDRSRNRNTRGTGLGLAIAKHLVEGHGGRLWADSEERRGSTFYFTLPAT